MNEEQKDKGLKRAIKEENGFRLPSNFAYRTMRKVEEAIAYAKRSRNEELICHNNSLYILNRMLYCRTCHLFRRYNQRSFHPN